MASICFRVSSEVVCEMGWFNPLVVSKKSKEPFLQPHAKMFGIWFEKATERTEEFVFLISSG